jgi:hypothetical protein
MPVDWYGRVFLAEDLCQFRAHQMLFQSFEYQIFEVLAPHDGAVRACPFVPDCGANKTHVEVDLN